MDISQLDGIKLKSVFTETDGEIIEPKHSADKVS